MDAWEARNAQLTNLFLPLLKREIYDVWPPGIQAYLKRCTILTFINAYLASVMEGFASTVPLFDSKMIVGIHQ